MSRKLLVLLTLALLTLFGLSVTVAQDQPVTITWLEWFDPEWGEDVIQELLANFEQETGIHVERTAVPWNNMYDLLLTNAQAGTATYDVLGMEACCWLSGIDKLGGIEPLDSYLDQDPDFVAGLTDMTVSSYLDRPLMLNWYIFPYSYVYNMRAFEKAGVEPPNSWAEMIQVSQALQELGVTPYPFGEGFAGDVHHVTYYLFGGRLAQLGGRILDENSRAVFNSPEGVQALNDWKAFYDSGLMMPGAIGMMTADAREALGAETIAAMFDGPFSQSIAKQVNPDIRIAFPPAWEDVAGGYVWSGSGLAISSNSAHKEEAWEFIKYMLSDEVSLALTEQVGLPFATQAVIDSLTTSDDPILSQIPAMLTQDPAHNFFTIPVPEQETLHREFVIMFQEVMSGNIEPQQALDDLAALWNEKLDEVR